MILILYTDGLLLTGKDPLMIKVRGSCLLNLEIMNHDTINQFLKLGKENLYCKSIKELLESGYENVWTLRLNFKKL